MAIAITEDIFWVGVNDNKTELFEELWPLPYGVSYNAYLIRDEKIALIDTVKKEFFDEFLKQVQPLLAGLTVGARHIFRRDQIAVALTLARALGLPHIRDQRQVFNRLILGIDLAQQNTARLVRVTGFEMRVDAGQQFG